MITLLFTFAKKNNILTSGDKSTEPIRAITIMWIIDAINKCWAQDGENTFNYFF